MSTNQKIGAATALVAAIVIFAAFQIAGGNVGAQTYFQPVFTNDTQVGPSATFKNVGASSHWLSYCTTNATSVSIALEASNDGQNYFQISQTGTTLGCGVVAASGYYQDIRANIYALNGLSASVTAYYTAAAFPSANTGILLAGAIPRPVAPAPSNGTTYWTSLDSAFSGSVFAGAAVITGVYVYNPTAAGVFLRLSETNTISGTMLIRYVPSQSGVDFELGEGVSFPTGAYASCSASEATLTDPPVPGCTVNIAYRSAQTANVSSRPGLILSSPEVSH